MLDPNCLFCKIIKKEIPANIVYEDEKTIVFRDINPKAPVHVLVVPKEHIKGATDLDDKYLGAIWSTINKVTKDLGIKEKGFRIIINSGKEGGQEVLHVHFHVIGGKHLSFPGL